MSESQDKNLLVQLSWQYWVTHMVYLVIIAVSGIIISSRILIVTNIDSKYESLIYLSVYSILIYIGNKKRVKRMIAYN